MLYQKILLRGFEAVPALIEHLDDQRLSRSITVGFNNFPTMPRHVGEIIADLVQAIAGEEFSRDWLQRQFGTGLDKAIVSEWWSKASKLGEEAYVREHVLPRDKSEEWPHQPHLTIIEARYATYLPELYREVLRRRKNIQSAPLTEAISKSVLPREEKLALFHSGASHAMLAHRRPAIHELRKLDPAAADAATLKVLVSLPKRTPGEVWTSEESAVAHLVIESDAPAVWDALVAAAKRAHVSLRMELIDPMNYTYIGEKHRAQRLRFLSQFLNDQTLRDMRKNSTLYGGPCAAFTFPRIEVRDFAASKIASILGFPDDPEPSWSSQRWAALRAKVTQAIEREVK